MGKRIREANKLVDKKKLYRVKVTLMFRGRQPAHIDLGRAVLDRVIAALADVGKVEMDAKLEGRNMTMVIAPK